MPYEYEQNKGRIRRFLEDTLPVNGLTYENAQVMSIILLGSEMPEKTWEIVSNTYQRNGPVHVDTERR